MITENCKDLCTSKIMLFKMVPYKAENGTLLAQARMIKHYDKSITSNILSSHFCNVLIVINIANKKNIKLSLGWSYVCYI